MINDTITVNHDGKQYVCNLIQTGDDSPTLKFVNATISDLTITLNYKLTNHGWVIESINLPNSGSIYQIWKKMPAGINDEIIEYLDEKYPFPKA